jgi:hypothetical protein
MHHDAKRKPEVNLQMYTFQGPWVVSFTLRLSYFQGKRPLQPSDVAGWAEVKL